jgi:L-ascorbate metabolism protein UlaG (beta-lactamase superfamily)
MRIEKYVHSCLLLSLEGTRMLFDPGKFSFVDHRVDPHRFQRLDGIVLTHGHPDHLDPDALAIIVKATGAMLYGNEQIAAKLQCTGLAVTVVNDAEFSVGAFHLKPLAVKHAPILSDQIPKVTAFLVNDHFLNPGDSFDRALDRFKGVETMALPVMAPFLTEIDAMAFAQRLAPHHVIPVHDGYARDYFLKQRYDAYEPYMQRAGIAFHRLEEVGQGITLHG